MGVVFKQSLNNTLITYLGFCIGSINHLFLFTRFLTPEYFGLVTVILSASAVLMSILAFGVPNTLIKYYSTFNDSTEVNGFLTLMLFIPFIMILPIWSASYLAYETIGNFLSNENPIVKGYVWYIFIIAISMAYFEIFYAWARVQMKSVFGNFMKEIYVRVGTMVLLILVYFEIISVAFFLKALVSLYVSRMLIIKLYAFSIRRPKLDFNLPKNSRSILSYTTLITLGASAAVILLEIDKVMLSQFLEIKNVAYYGIATYIAAVIIVPSRSMHQITYPLTAEIMNSGDMQGLKALYRKTSLTLFIASGILFLLIIMNIEQLYALLPEPYRGGFVVVFIVGIIKVYDSVLGNINAILYNSIYYRAILVMGVLLAILTILFNLWLIPKYGIDGAAMASLLAFFLYNTVKLGYVKLKFGMQPFTSETFRVLLLLGVTTGLFYFLDFPFHPVLNILFKSTLMILFYVFIIYKFRISEDIYQVISKFLGKRP